MAASGIDAASSNDVVFAMWKVGAVGCAHPVEGSDAISGMEFCDVRPDAVDVAGNVVAGVGFGHAFRHLPRGGEGGVSGVKT